MKRQNLGRRALLVGAGGVLAAPAIARAQGQNGVALVIGNSKYHWEASLPNAKRDSTDVAKAFQGLGLKTELVQDATRDASLRAIDGLRSAARGAGFAAFYFAGHGVSWNRENYIVPVDADLSDPKASERLIVAAPDLSAATKEASRRLLVFDSCRNNPADGWRQKETLNLAKIDAVDQMAAAAREPNTLLVFSTGPGRIALDGPPGENSPFASSFLRQIGAPSVDLQPLAVKLRRDLLVATQGRQVVWDQSTFAGPFVLNGKANRQTSSAPPGDPSRIIELGKAYEFANRNGLTMPAGLIAYRAPDGSPHADKIGSFKFDMKVAVAAGGGSGTHMQPSLILVLSATDTAAEVVYLTRQWRMGNGSTAQYFQAKLSGPSLEILSPDEGAIFNFRWRNRTSGSHSYLAGPLSRGNTPPMTNTPFERLDG